MVMFGASGVADGGHTVLAHVGGSHLTDSTFGSVIEIGLSSPDCLLAGMLVFYSDGGHAGYLEYGTVKMAPRPNLEMAITESDDTIRNILERDACLLVNAGDRIGNVRERRERHFEAAPDRQACRERFGRILTRRRGDAEHPPCNDASQKLAFVLAVFHHFVERHATLGLRHRDLGDIAVPVKSVPRILRISSSKAAQSFVTSLCNIERASSPPMKPTPELPRDSGKRSGRSARNLMFASRVRN
jgi:hypothetical protein